MQSEAYLRLRGPYYARLNDCDKSNVYVERHQSIAKELNNLVIESYKLHDLAHNYERLGDCEKASYVCHIARYRSQDAHKQAEAWNMEER